MFDPVGQEPMPLAEDATQLAAAWEKRRPWRKMLATGLALAVAGEVLQRWLGNRIAAGFVWMAVVVTFGCFGVVFLLTRPRLFRRNWWKTAAGLSLLVHAMVMAVFFALSDGRVSLVSPWMTGVAEGVVFAGALEIFRSMYEEDAEVTPQAWGDEEDRDEFAEED